jgi:hypothetical protein
MKRTAMHVTSAAHSSLDTMSIVISTGGTALIAASLWVLYLVVAGRIPDIVICI